MIPCIHSDCNVLCHVMLLCTHVAQTRLKSETARQTDTLHAMQENFNQQKAVYASTIAQLQVCCNNMIFMTLHTFSCATDMRTSITCTISHADHFVAICILHI
jgi:hypothetical protein